MKLFFIHEVLLFFTRESIWFGLSLILVMSERATLDGIYVRLEPLGHHHAEGLAGASSSDTALYRWSPVPQGLAEATQYIQTVVSWREAGTAEPFAIIRKKDDAVIGCTRFFNIERWAWPPGHQRYGRILPDAAEIGYSWLSASAVRTGANTESKLLLLTHAFEYWKVFRICFHSDMRNLRSRTAIERLGAKYEGELRAHRLANDLIPRNSARFSILDSEWAEVKQRLQSLLK
jgi:RimJ/RimL family protein N-acetyltransferase